MTPQRTEWAVDYGSVVGWQEDLGREAAEAELRSVQAKGKYPEARLVCRVVTYGPWEPIGQS